MMDWTIPEAPVSDYVSSLDGKNKTTYFMKLGQLGFYREEDDPFLMNTNENVSGFIYFFGSRQI